MSTKYGVITPQPSFAPVAPAAVLETLAEFVVVRTGKVIVVVTTGADSTPAWVGRIWLQCYPYRPDDTHGLDIAPEIPSYVPSQDGTASVDRTPANASCGCTISQAPAVTFAAEYDLPEGKYRVMFSAADAAQVPDAVTVSVIGAAAAL